MPYKRTRTIAGKKTMQYVGQVRRRINGKPLKKLKTFSTSAEAKAWEVEMKKLPDEKFILEVKGQGRVEMTNTDYSLLDFSSDYLDYAKRYDTKVWNAKKRDMQRLLNMEGVEVKPRDFDSRMPAEDFTVSMSEKLLTAQYVLRGGNAANNTRKNLVAAWNWGILIKSGFPKLNPFREVSKFPEKRTPRYVPDMEDFWLVHDHVSEVDQLILKVFLYTGARKMEIFRLNKNTDLDFKKGRIRFWNRKGTNGDVTERWIPMIEQLYVAMLNYVQQLKGDYVFPDPKTGKPYINRRWLVDRHCDAINKEFAEEAEKTGKPAKTIKPFGWHAIRHLSAQSLIDLGENLRTVQAILGHKHMSTTEIYVKNYLGIDKRVLEGLTRNKKPSEVASDGSV